ncbi:MAG: hypothetical protein GY853_13475 [PVC group bacterium]|nr:hypothetical protein [PVC group bacterium]
MRILEGKKTYVVAILIGLANAAHFMGYITPEQLTLILGLLGAGGLASLRDGVKKSGK